MASFFVFEKKNKEIKNEADKVFCALFVFYSSISIHILSKRKYNKQGKKLFTPECYNPHRFYNK